MSERDVAVLLCWAALVVIVAGLVKTSWPKRHKPRPWMCDSHPERPARAVWGSRWSGFRYVCAECDVEIREYEMERTDPLQ